MRSVSSPAIVTSMPATPPSSTRFCWTSAGAGAWAVNASNAARTDTASAGGSSRPRRRMASNWLCCSLLIGILPVRRRRCSVRQMIAVTLVSCPRRNLAIPCPACAQDEQGRVVRRHALCGLRRSRPDLAQLEKLEAEGLDLRKDAEHRGLVFKQAGEHGLTAGQLGRHRGKGGQSSRSEPTPYPDGVQARRHATTVLHD